MGTFDNLGWLKVDPRTCDPMHDHLVILNSKMATFPALFQGLDFRGEQNVLKQLTMTCSYLLLGNSIIMACCSTKVSLSA